MNRYNQFQPLTYDSYNYFILGTKEKLIIYTTELLQELQVLTFIIISYEDQNYFDFFIEN